MRGKLLYPIGAVMLVAMVGLAVRADDFWTKKEWQKWSDGDCGKMLNDSPWSRTFTMSKANVSAALHPTSPTSDPISAPTQGANTGTSGETKEEISYIVQLRSALPVRQAIVRQTQIKQRYDRLNPEQKKVFDDRTAQFLTANYDSAIVVDVTYDSNIQAFQRALAGYWQGLAESYIPQDAHLILESGARISPARFVSRKGSAYEFELIFPRMQNGEPAIGANDKAVGLEFTHPDLPGVTDFPSQRVFVEFKTDKMQMDGKLVY